MAANPTRIGEMIGNGFDIALGLKTKYEDFLAEYKRNNAASSSSAIRWLCAKIDDDGKSTHALWRDAEVAFAGLPFGDGNDAVNIFHLIQTRGVQLIVCPFPGENNFPQSGCSTNAFCDSEKSECSRPSLHMTETLPPQ